MVADIDNDLEVGVFLGAYRQLAQRQDLETRRLCAESCAAVLKAATPRRSAIVESHLFQSGNLQRPDKNSSVVFRKLVSFGIPSLSLYFVGLFLDFPDNNNDLPMI